MFDIMALQLKKVIITDSLDDSCREILQQNGISADVKEGLTKEELLREISVRMFCLLDHAFSG